MMKYLRKGKSIAAINIISETDKTLALEYLGDIRGWIYIPRRLRKSDLSYKVHDTLSDAMNAVRQVLLKEVNQAQDLLERSKIELAKVEQDIAELEVNNDQ
jgi:hypothetical protein